MWTEILIGVASGILVLLIAGSIGILFIPKVVLQQANKNLSKAFTAAKSAAEAYEMAASQAEEHNKELVEKLREVNQKYEDTLEALGHSERRAQTLNRALSNLRTEFFNATGQYPKTVVPNIKLLP